MATDGAYFVVAFSAVEDASLIVEEIVDRLGTPWLMFGRWDSSDASVALAGADRPGQSDARGASTGR